MKVVFSVEVTGSEDVGICVIDSVKDMVTVDTMLTGTDEVMATWRVLLVPAPFSSSVDCGTNFTVGKSEYGTCPVLSCVESHMPFMRISSWRLTLLVSSSTVLSLMIVGLGSDSLNAEFIRSFRVIFIVRSNPLHALVN